MKNTTASDFKVGIFVFAALAIFVFTLFYTKGLSVSLSLKEYVVYFPKVSGLNEGDPVNVNGVRKGEVKKIELEGDSVKITFNISKDIKIRKDYEIYVAATELTGGKVLYLEPGKSSEMIGENVPLHGEATADFGALMKSMDEITGQVKTLLTEFGKSNENINNVLTNVNGIVGDEGLKANIRTTVSNLQTASNNLNSLISESRSGINGLTSKAGNTMGNIDNAVNLNSEELQKTMTEIRTLTSQVDTLVGNLNLVVTDLKSDSSSVGKLIYDDEFYMKVNKALTEIEKLTKSIRKGGVKINLF